MFLTIRRAVRPAMFVASPPPESVTMDPAPELLFAARAYRPGDVVLCFEEAEWRARRDRETVEHPSGGHLFDPMLARASHSCEPNCCVSFPTHTLVAIRPIEPGEAISYDYETTESWFAHPFWCRCASRRCRGRIG